ncbi:MAG TPA: adenylate/guanylate cyclase domain-containing protein [Gemmatimonadaceae bacterium]|nr:adenylate/guanylate cyclase domain-containing protein [Gemmatimonadaceae bacterium]
MPFRLVSADGQHSFELRPGTPLVLGRALSSDLPVMDPTVSRTHAELLVDSGVVSVRDLGSSNGTFVNGVRVTSARLVPGDRILFGKMLFELRELSPVLVDDTTAERLRRAARAGTTIIRQVPVPDADQSLERALRASGVQEAVEETAAVLPQHERDRLKLTLLLEISKALTRVADLDALLEKMTHFAFRLMDADQVSLLLVNDAGELELRMSRGRQPQATLRPVPLELARTALADKVALLSHTEETSTAGSAATTRAAVCAPLLGSEGKALGVLYVDSVERSRPVEDEDLEFLVAFAGIGAVAVDNIRFAEQVRRDALVRGNFERFFTPHVAERIASGAADLYLGGERRRVAVLFADIRGFTALASRLSPDETARLLNEYFTEMAECVFRFGGTLDKFIGDEVMAQWGAPLSEPDDADRALDAALAMLAALDQLNDRWLAQGKQALQIGIGINYGEAFAGFLGSERRLEYTVIGDVVNTAKRLCTAAEGGQILVSDAFRKALTRPRSFVEHGRVVLPGRGEPVVVLRALV